MTPKSTALSLVLAALGVVAPGQPAHAGVDRPLRAVATTTFVGDVVRNIAGDALAVTVLLPPGADPHAFEPAPKDAAVISGADVLFVNGLGLELFLDPLLQTVAETTPGSRVVTVSEGIVPRRMARDGKPGGEPDPHVWMDPLNVVVWTENIERALARLDPPHAAAFARRATAYRGRLRELDAWIRAATGSVPADRRVLVTDHDDLGYFADRYGFTLVGSVIPGFSTLAEPSARELARLQEEIMTTHARLVVVGESANDLLAGRVARDTGARVVRLYTESLSGSPGPAATYLDFMEHNVKVLCDALKAEAP